MKKDMEKINKSDMSLQDLVRIDKNNCDHIGFYTPLGHEVYPEDIATGRFKIVTSVLCMMCGVIFHQISMVINNEGMN